MAPPSSTKAYTDAWLAGYDGTQFYTRTYAAAAPRAVLLYVHGFSEHIARYEWAHSRCASEGITVFAFDQRGFGRTALDAAHRSKKSSYGRTNLHDQLSDIEWWLKHLHKEYPGLPLFTMGHSMVSVVHSRIRTSELTGTPFVGWGAYPRVRDAHLSATVSGVHRAPVWCHPFKRTLVTVRLHVTACPGRRGDAKLDTSEPTVRCLLAERRELLCFLCSVDLYSWLGILRIVPLARPGREGRVGGRPNEHTERLIKMSLGYTEQRTAPALVNFVRYLTIFDFNLTGRAAV